MTHSLDDISIIDVSPDNVEQTGIYCIKDKKAPGYQATLDWFVCKPNAGAAIRIAVDGGGKQLGFVEYLPSEIAWRPVKAEHFLFIQCIGLFVTGARDQGIGSLLLNAVEQDAMVQGKKGLCTMSSNGPWLANKSLFLKNGFMVADTLERFELLVKPLSDTTAQPSFIDWTARRASYPGWHLLYADQCPWHQKSVTDITHAALEHGIPLTVRKLLTAREAQNAPSGFGTFSLLKDGVLLADHYISRTRFLNIVRSMQNVKKGKV